LITSPTRYNHYQQATLSIMYVTGIIGSRVDDVGGGYVGYDLGGGTV